MAGPLLQPLLILLLSLALGSAGKEGLHPAQDTGERIINGVRCLRGSHPWQVALYQDEVFQCAGVLVHPQWVLTVAHCRVSNYLVQMGSDFLIERYAQKITATEFFSHPRFDPVTNIHNLMLVKLSSPAKLSSIVRTIYVPKTCKHPGTSCTVSGWGTFTGDVVRYPIQLMCSNVNLISYKECRKFYPTVLRKFTICAASPENRSYACKGDSGSPLICEGTLQGLVSSDYFPCPQPFDPIIYTRVCKYSKWIYDTIKSNSVGTRPFSAVVRRPGGR